MNTEGHRGTIHTESGHMVNSICRIRIVTMNTARYWIAAGLLIRKAIVYEVGPTGTRPQLSRLVLNTDGGHLENCIQVRSP